MMLLPELLENDHDLVVIPTGTNSDAAYAADKYFRHDNHLDEVPY
jgi:hypothetical protein